MDHLLLWLAIIALLCLLVVGVALYRRGAISVDKTKVKQEADSAWGHIQDDVRNWRDKLDKKQ
jgi:ArsR family metal-binding transcriptional regulator